jgi:hypothetical protein
MNVIKYIFLLSIFLTVYTCADVDISSQIAQLKNAKKSEKYMIMNKIKMQISQLNSTQRAKAISQLRASMSNTGNTQTQISGSLGVPQMPTMPSMGNIPIPTVPTVPIIPIIPMSTQSIPKGGQ